MAQSLGPKPGLIPLPAASKLTPARSLTTIEHDSAFCVVQLRAPGGLPADYRTDPTGRAAPAPLFPLFFAGNLQPLTSPLGKRGALGTAAPMRNTIRIWQFYRRWVG
jgi:hypothetical protein